MDLLSLRNALETALVEELGVYELPNGAITPAISVRAAGEPMTAGTRVTGLECVLMRDPELIPISQYTGQQAFSRWTVFLMSWTAGLDLTRIASRLLLEWPGAQITTLSPRRGSGPYSQLRLSLQTDPEQDEDW
jgi:hypothetical protein